MSRTATTAAQGTFITIDGPDGGGKTTHAKRLRDHLAARGLPVLLTREPGGTWLGERLRDVLLARTSAAAAPTDPLTDALLFNAARRQIVGEVIRPALESGTSVICARFADSTLAYQGYGAGVPLDTLRALEAIATGGLRAHRTILLDVPAEVGLGRKAAEQTRFETDFDIDFHQRVRAGFLALAAADPDRFRVVDARDDAGAVFARVLAAAD
jgi:dTMP kinase